MCRQRLTGCRPRLPVLCMLVALLAAGCGVPPALLAPAILPATLLPVRVGSRTLAPPTSCTNTFVPHALDHTTTMSRDKAVRMFESNGAGVAVDDLDDDGNLDVVLANLDGHNAILWNQGSFRFQKETLPHGDSRAVNIVDVDGDGRPDIVFTRRLDRPTYWHNQGTQPTGSRFVPAVLPGVYFPAYSMAWADFDGAGRLDLVTGSYDAALEQALIGNTSSPFGSGAGVYYYKHQGDAFVPRQLASEAQALAIAVPDLNGDGRPDLLVGNDFDLPDASWVRDHGGWRAVAPFKTTTRNTMSLDAGDIDNDGTPEIFAADMKPYAQDVQTLARWRPMMEAMPPPNQPGPQINENVLQVRRGDGSFRNEAYQRGVDATGWSWSAQFGDLDNDGYLDLYVVNGMIAEGLLDYLPNSELVEQNEALRNDGTGHFARMPAWGLGSTASGRGMTMADLDNDGKLDIVVNNLGRPAVVFENRLCGGSSIEVDLRWPHTLNTRAIGARLVLRTSTGSYYRDVRTSGGYLSGVPARVHIGFPSGSKLYRLEIVWPDGRVSSLDQPAPHTLVTVTR